MSDPVEHYRIRQAKNHRIRLLTTGEKYEGENGMKTRVCLKRLFFYHLLTTFHVPWGQKMNLKGGMQLGMIDCTIYPCLHTFVSERESSELGMVLEGLHTYWMVGHEPEGF